MEQIWEIRWTNTAANEFEVTIDWLLYKFNKKIAASFRDKVWSKVQRVSKSPLIGKPSPYLENCRQCDTHIDILRVFDGRQNTSKLQ
jgi:plasmid stabilization system protein ParE